MHALWRKTTYPEAPTTQRCLAPEFLRRETAVAPEAAERLYEDLVAFLRMIDETIRVWANSGGLARDSGLLLEIYADLPIAS